MPVADQAIDESEAGQLLAPMCAHDHVALAVSGGSDSVALMVLAARWAKTVATAPRLSVLTVNHGLRPEAAGEAARVGRWAKALGLDHATLCWQGGKPASGVQAAAREARYELMSDWCLEHGAQAIVTAHAADDQAETLLMRLARGSGVDGLAGMMAETLTPWPVLRPLLGVTRARLRAMLVADGHTWIEDPSNNDASFERIRMRRALAELAPLGLDAETIALSARRLARARHALDLGARGLTQAALVCHEAGYGELDLDAWLAAPEEIQVRVLQRLVWQFGSHDMPRMAALERVAQWIAGGEGRARTLSGCRIVRRKHQLVLGREAGRIDQVPVPLPCRSGRGEALWDRRFKLVVHGAKASNELSVAPLGAISDALAGEIRPQDRQMPAFVRHSLPVVLDGGHLHSVPHLGISGQNASSNLSVDVRFMTN